MTEVDSSLATDVQSCIDQGNSLSMNVEDSSQNIDTAEGQLTEESGKNGDSFNEDEKQPNETAPSSFGKSPPPPPVVNPWNKSTKNARNSTEKGRARLNELA